MISGILKEIRFSSSLLDSPLAIYQDSYHRNEIIYCIKTTSRRRGRKRKTGVVAILELADKRRKALAPPRSSSFSFRPLPRDFILLPLFSFHHPSSRILRETSAQFSTSSPFFSFFLSSPSLSRPRSLSLIAGIYQTTK